MYRNKFEQIMPSNLLGSLSYTPPLSSSGSLPPSPLFPYSSNTSTYLQQQNAYSFNTLGYSGQSPEVALGVIGNHQKQQQQLKLQEQQLLQTQTQLALAAISSNKQFPSPTNAKEQEDNEISNSLRLFALHSSETNKQGNDSTKTIKDTMKEFDSNGFSSDYLNLQQNALKLNNLGCAQLINNVAGSKGINYNTPQTILNRPLLYQQQLLLQQQLLQQQNLWMYMPNPLYQQGFSYPTMGLPAQNMELLLKKPKRFVPKNEKYGSTKHCVFCENNKEPEEVIRSHAVRDAQGRVLCPKLRIYTCPICKASGDNAHTVKYCPQKPIYTMEDIINAETMLAKKSCDYTYNN